MLHCLAEMPGVTIDEHELHFTRSGKGPPLLLIQGLGGHTAHWGAHFPALLAQKLDVIEQPERVAGLVLEFLLD